MRDAFVDMFIRFDRKLVLVRLFNCHDKDGGWLSENDLFTFIRRVGSVIHEQALAELVEEGLVEIALGNARLSDSGLAVLVMKEIESDE